MAVTLLARAGEPGAERLAAALHLPVCDRALALFAVRAVVVHVRLPVAELGRAALACTLAGARGVIATPLGAATRLPWWERRFHRFVLGSQAEALAWAAHGLALGRLVVVEPDGGEAESMRAVYEEVLAMTARAARVRPG